MTNTELFFIIVFAVIATACTSLVVYALYCFKRDHDVKKADR